MENSGFNNNGKGEKVMYHFHRKRHPRVYFACYSTSLVSQTLHLSCLLGFSTHKNSC